MSALLPSMGNFGAVQAGRCRIDGGKSHSWERPTRSFSNPRAHTISVALAISETMRGMRSTLWVSRSWEKRTRATPSPPWSRCNEAATHFGVAGEREGVRGPALLLTAFPLTPTLSPTTVKRAEASEHLDRVG